MNSYTFGIVSEGPTDFEVITHIIMKVVPGNHNFRPIQPNLSETPDLGVVSSDRHSNGWKGVLSWCESTTSSLSILEFMDGTNVDFLVIQVDAEIAKEPEINCARPCPRAEDTVIELETIIKRKLRINDFDNRIICCIPSENTEAWVLTGIDKDMLHHGDGKYVECIKKPDEVISKPPFSMIRRKGGKAKKNQVEYREKCVPIVVEKWDYIRSYCTQAEKLHQRLLQL